MDAANSVSNVSKLIECLTTNGSTQLQCDTLRQLKKHCKDGGDSMVELVFRMLFTQMERKHSQIRFSTLLVCNELFLRSHRFRTLLLESKRFNHFLELTLGCNEKRPLPPPKKVAKLLKSKCIELLDSWNSSFGNGYAFLKSTHKFLKENNIIDFSERAVITASERERQQSAKEKADQRLKSKIENAVNKFNELEADIKPLFTQFDSCLQLIVPKFGMEETDATDEAANGTRNQSLSSKIFQPFDVTVNHVLTVNKTTDNDVVIENLRDVYKQFVVHFLPKVKSLLQTMSKGSEFCETELKKAIDLKCKIMSALKQYVELKVKEADFDSGLAVSEESDASDDDFETVEEKDLELIIPQHRRKEYGLCENTSTNDLEMPSTSGVSMFMQCKAPLPNGKLCPRRDKIKCPFHGKIIPRNDCGDLLDAEARQKEEKQKENEAVDWQDPELLRDIKAQIGVDLTMPRRGENKVKGKGKRKKYPGLDDIRTCDETPRTRLSKKIFTKEVQARVAEDLDLIDSKLSNKFGDQWNYAMNS
ncbi:UV-stimulated scaffold protein A-like isoform X1 [Dinothrombium tinctorium]|uniref:UV-stimulated scaffold protein A-like isoform X1 n=1 Tax=Dinothrombium tinctorium TaxID=1965070 RepID=A0A3S3NBI3_9ACAR|nr:UV-stimulated scaffold protein A-like isoform X1 [Dinothrombium tinctorium]RWR99917.1 UV-stimulated scaffold protein A-like isoform X1 [Dinothrombium tinctorium]RWR99990.1 UV-stimulated scaffold protein A-like isoform X1 [Dinothrombium tinctorium]RWS00132.1 UV-stimulated scaffold protein A-like isoform X1 [Dinothrombium tinctorium]RWS00999.1 UV-stimulated scaffold protein A-like isoform X1 [Dinothrombium tinctorium]